MNLLKHKNLQQPKNQIYTIYQNKINTNPFHTFFFINKTKNSKKKNTYFSTKINNLIKFTLSYTKKNTITSLNFPTIYLLILTKYTTYITTNKYNQSTYNYTKPQIYTPTQPSFKYTNTKIKNKLSKNLKLNNNLNKILPILLIYKLTT